MLGNQPEFRDLVGLSLIEAIDRIAGNERGWGHAFSYHDYAVILLPLGAPMDSARLATELQSGRLKEFFAALGAVRMQVAAEGGYESNFEALEVPAGLWSKPWWLQRFPASLTAMQGGVALPPAYYNPRIIGEAEIRKRTEPDCKSVPGVEALEAAAPSSKAMMEAPEAAAPPGGAVRASKPARRARSDDEILKFAQGIYRERQRQKIKPPNVDELLSLVRMGLPGVDAEQAKRVFRDPRLAALRLKRGKKFQG